MAISPDGRRLFVTCSGTDEVVLLATDTRAVVDRFPVGRRPHGVALSPDGGRLYVGLRGEDRVVALDPTRGNELATVSVGRSPCGLALDPEGKRLIVANAGSDDISLVDTATMTERVRLIAGREPYAVSVTADGTRAFVANRLAGVHHGREVPVAELTEVDLDHGRVGRRHALRSAHLSEGVTVSPARGVALVTLARVRNLLPITQLDQGWVMTSGLGVLSPRDGCVRQFPLDEVNAYYADPSGVVVDEANARVYVASGGADCVSVVDLSRLEALAAGCRGDGPGRWADHLGISSEYVLARIPTGPNPRALLLAPGGERLYVAEHLNDAIAVVDTETLEVVDRFALGGSEERTEVRRGEIVFHRAAVTYQGQFSCRSCHPDGHVDGLTYDFSIDGMGKNILDNRSLLGIADTAPFKWNGKNESLHKQCGPRFAKVLTMADPFAPEDLDCLVAYIESLPPPSLPPDPGREPTPAQQRGKAIFERTRANDGREIPVAKRCTTCHPPPLYTDRLTASVGTRTPTDASDRFDTPHLLGIAHSAPYLHDGRATTLEEIWTVYSPQETHGIVNDLTKTQLNDLIEFLKSL